MRHILYNPKSGGGHAHELAEKLKSVGNDEVTLVDVTTIEDYKSFFEGVGSEDVILVGGDGTINKFINNTAGMELQGDVYFYPSGTGNDFALDIGITDTAEPVLISEYIKDLPTVTVNGADYKFINGVGYGIDGYCCEVGDAMHAKGKTPNYTAIAIKGLLFHYKPTNATVIVDGVEHKYKKVWLAPAMFGRHYGGGMIPTPEQKRGSDRLSVMIFHGSGKLKTLMIFPKIFKGEHVKKEKNVTVLEGSSITVKFDRPTPLQIDGETILGVTEYTAKR